MNLYPYQGEVAKKERILNDFVIPDVKKIDSVERRLCGKISNSVITTVFPEV